jgi:hypothetical protein
VDFREQREIYMRIDQMLVQADVELPLIVEVLKTRGESLTDHKKAAWYRHGFRCAIARRLCGMPLRPFTSRLADSMLLQWFTHCGDYGIVNPCSKSALDRFEQMFDLSELEHLIDGLTLSAADPNADTRLGALTQALDLGDVFADCTCVKANVHFPTDWVLLVDAVRTLIKSIVLIRAHGLHHRIPEPETFLRRINALAMAMSANRRQADSKRKRKEVLRSMKKLNKTVEAHAKRYRELLDKEWQQTDWSRKQAEQVLKRMDNVLDQLPAAIHQAHERIIGERKVLNEEKILSLYDEDIHVIVRGKASGEVEFGNKLYIAEQREGVLVDWTLFKDTVPSDSHLVQQSVERLEDALVKPTGYIADRGFTSKPNVKWLHEKGVRDGLCAKDPCELRERRRDPWYAEGQKRRGNTEARVGVFKNVFLGGVLREKSFERRNRSLIWSVLAHNLWVLARKSLADEAERLEVAA